MGVNIYKEEDKFDLNLAEIINGNYQKDDKAKVVGALTEELTCVFGSHGTITAKYVEMNKRKAAATQFKNMLGNDILRLLHTDENVDLSRYEYITDITSRTIVFKLDKDVLNLTINNYSFVDEISLLFFKLGIRGVANLISYLRI